MSEAPAATDRFVAVNGLSLHYVDWGGAGPHLLFLTGLADSAHIFDELAPRFTDRFHAIGLTRRGHGRSDKPPEGYDTLTLVEDVRAFMDAVGIDVAVLAGHSLAGDELTHFAVLYPNRVRALIYLDAALDRTDLPDVLGSAPVPFPEPSGDDLASWEALERWYAYTYRIQGPAVSANLHETFEEQDKGRLVFGMPESIHEALYEGTFNSHPPFASIKTPVLSFCAFSKDPFLLPLGAREETRRKVRGWVDNTFDPYLRLQCSQFRRLVPHARVIEIEEATHYFYLDHLDPVVSEMRDFLPADVAS